MKNIRNAAGIALCIALIQSCALISASGTTLTKTYSFQNFTSISLSNAFHGTVTHSATRSVSLSFDGAASDLLNVYESGTTLYIGLKPAALLGDFRLEATVTVPELTSIDLSGASSCDASGFTSPSFALNLSGASSLNVSSIASTTFAADLSGMSVVLASAFSCTSSSFTLSGASTFSADNASAVGASAVDLSGASSLWIPCSSVAGVLSGASSLSIPTGVITTGIYTSGGSSVATFAAKR